MAKVIGSVDDRGRPIVRLDLTRESLLLVVDTGFNGDLLVTRSAADLLGVTPTARETDVELGDGTIASLNQGRAVVPWLGSQRVVRVLVSDTWTTTPDAPVGLLGTDLLTPHLLLVDFDARSVEIETQ